MKKAINILAILLAFTSQAMAVDYGFSVGGEPVTSSNCSNITRKDIIVIGSGGHLYYLSSTNTLYVKNVTIDRTGKDSRAIYNTDCAGLTVVFEGTNKLKAKNSSAFRCEKNTTIKCANGGSVTIEGVDEDAVCPYNGSQLVLDNANVTISASNSEGVDGNNSGYMTIRDSKLTASGKNGAITKLKALRIDGASTVTLTGNNSAVTLNNVAQLVLEDMKITSPSGAVFNSTQKAICVNGSPTRSTIILNTTAVEVNSTNFPDSNFRTCVSRNIDNNKDGYLTYRERKNITAIDASQKTISDMKGIGYFPALKTLYCYRNSIKGTKMSNLISYLPSWTSGGELYVYDSYYYAEQNECTASQVSTANGKGWSVKYYNSAYSWTDYPGCDVCWVNATNFPDNAFRSYVSSSIDNDNNEWLSSSELANVTIINVNNKNISSLEGIGRFSNLERLFCSANKLEKIDVSKNSKLIYLSCAQNKISGENMTNLVKGLPQRGSNVERGELTIYAENLNDQNRCMSSDVEVANNRGWTVYYYPTGRAELYAGYDALAINSTNFPNSTFRSYVSTSAIDKNSDKFLTNKELAAVKEINVENKNINDLTGIKHFTALERLYCGHNQLTELNVSENTKLQELSCEYNSLNNLILGRLDYLGTLKCAHNELTSIDISQTSLGILDCSHNRLTSIGWLPSGMKWLVCFCNKIKDPYTSIILNDRYYTGYWLGQGGTSQWVYDWGILEYLDSTDPLEENEYTSDFLDEAEEKSWNVFDWNGGNPRLIERVATDIRTVEDKGEGRILPVYNLNGQRFDSTPNKRGVYIRNVKKIVVK